MAKFDLAAAMKLQKVSKLDTEAKMIPLNLIDPHPDNFFQVESDITDLAESIQLNGLCQPLVVTPTDGGRYRVIAGHRRRMALLKLAETEPEKYKDVSCIVREPATPDLEMLMLIQTNTEAREIGWQEKNKAAAEVERILIKMQKEQGVVLPGKMRKHVAELIKTSESQIARARFIDKNLTSEAKKAGLSDSASYALAHLPQEQQQELLNHYQNRPWMIDNSVIKKYKANVDAGRDPFYVSPEDKKASIRDCYTLPKKDKKCQKCNHYDKIIEHFKSKATNDSPCKGTNGCCQYCESCFQCEDLCPALRADIKKTKESLTYLFNRRLHAARIAAGITDAEERYRRNMSQSELIRYESNVQLDLKTLADLCRVYGCTPNQILGFEPMPPEAQEILRQEGIEK